MCSFKKSARVAGALFIIAMFASLGGGFLISGVISSANNFAVTTENRAALITGILLELVNAVCVVGIAALLAPVLRRTSETAADWYLSIRTCEAVACAMIVLAPLALLYFEGPQNIGANAAAEMLFAVRTGVSNALIPLFFFLGAGVLYLRLYSTRIVPRYISVWGLGAVILAFAANAIGLIWPSLLGMGPQMALVLPMILNELFLGGWLIVKGFSESVNNK